MADKYTVIAFGCFWIFCFFPFLRSHRIGIFSNFVFLKLRSSRKQFVIEWLGDELIKEFKFRIIINNFNYNNVTF